MMTSKQFKDFDAGMKEICRKWAYTPVEPDTFATIWGEVNLFIAQFKGNEEDEHLEIDYCGNDGKPDVLKIAISHLCKDARTNYQGTRLIATYTYILASSTQCDSW